MERVIRHLLPLPVALVAAVSTPSALAAKSVDGPSLAKSLLAGRGFAQSGVVVRGPVNLEAADVVAGLFRCRSCTFRNRVSAPDVTFARTLDLSGSTFERDVSFRGATFQAPALFGTAAIDETGRGGEQPTSFRRDMDFSLAFFEEFASFRRSAFIGTANFEDTRFSDVTFARASFNAEARFAQVSFRGAALFFRTLFGNGARSASPSSADPGRWRATFEDSDFRGRTDFSRAFFYGGATFTRAQLAEGALFLDTSFSTGSTEEAAKFQSLASAGDLNFTFASFEHAQRSPAGLSASFVAVFSELVCARSLVLRDAEIGDNERITMSRLQVGDLVMDVEDVRHVANPDDRRAVLQTIEESAKARGDLDIANDAHYALRVLREQSYSPLGRALDYVFYRGIAGYFVRPIRPVLVLVLLVTVAAAIRAGRTRGSHTPPGNRPSPGRRVWAGVRLRAADFLVHVLNTFSLVGPRWSGGDRGELPLASRLEVLAYRLLLVCALLGLANSNPTLREMVDTLF